VEKFPRAHQSAQKTQQIRGTTIADRHWRVTRLTGHFTEAIMMVRLFKGMFVVAALVVAGTVLIVSAPARATDDDTAALYNTKCKMCHGATAEKKMDKTKPDDVLMQIVLDGNTPDQAKALVGYMKSLQ
jgi:hypothetical protein